MSLLNAILQNDTVKVMVLDNPKTFIEYLKEPNTLIALFAFIVSVAGLYISVRYNRKTLEQTIKHNKLSVEPILAVPFTLSHDEKNLKLEIVNSGFGPALVTKFHLVYEKETLNGFYNLIAKLDKPLDYKILYYKFPASHYSVPISSNSKICIFEFRYTDMDQYNKLKSILKKTKYDIEYETMYGEKRIIDNDVYNI